MPIAFVFLCSLAWRTPIVINGMPFNRENELLDVRVQELTEVVDAFLVVESRYTQYGQPKPLYFKPHPNPKVVHVVSDWVPTESGCALGWENEGHQRDYAIQSGLSAVYDHLGIPPYHMDILIMTDADEIPNRAAVRRIKSRPPIDNRIYPIQMRRYLYSFAWRERNGNQQAAYGNVDTWRQWKVHGATPAWGPPLSNGGWHCTKCFRLEEFNDRLKDYLCGDGIRWGDYEWPIETVQGLVHRGIWIGARPTQRSRRASPHEAPLAAKRYPFLVNVPPGDHQQGRIRMPYCGDPNKDLQHLQKVWCD